MKKFFQITISFVLIAFFAACDSDITENDIFGIGAEPQPISIAVTTQMSNVNCGNDLQTLNFSITYLDDGNAFDNRTFTDSIERDSVFTIIADSAQYEAADSVGVILRLVDYNPSNPTQDLGEQLTNTTIRIANDSLTLFNRSDFEDLQICNLIQYGVHVNHNLQTGETSITYLTGETQPSEYTVQLRAVGSANCDTQTDWTDFNLAYLQDDEPLAPIFDSVQIDSTYSRSVTLEAVNNLSLNLGLVDFNEENPTAEAGEQLQNIQVTVLDANGVVLNTTNVEDLFICQSSRYGVQLDYSIETNTFEFDYSNYDFQDPGVVVEYQGVFELQQSCSGSSIPPLGFADIEVFADGTSQGIENFEGADEEEFTYSSLTLEGNLIQFRIDLPAFDIQNPNLAFSNQGVKNQSFRLVDAETAEMIFESNNIQGLFICTDTVYEILITYNRATGEFRVDDQIYQF